jgi:hypothetical protein
MRSTFYINSFYEQILSLKILTVFGIIQIQATHDDEYDLLTKYPA